MYVGGEWRVGFVGDVIGGAEYITGIGVVLAPGRLVLDDENGQQCNADKQ